MGGQPPKRLSTFQPPTDSNQGDLSPHSPTTTHKFRFYPTSAPEGKSLLLACARNGFRQTRKASVFKLLQSGPLWGKKLPAGPGYSVTGGGAGKKGEKTELAYKPDSVRIPTRKGGVRGSHSSGPPVARRLVRPYPGAKDGPSAPLFGLAPGGVYKAPAVTDGPGELLPHRFTLTPALAGAVYFLLHFPRLATGRR